MMSIELEQKINSNSSLGAALVAAPIGAATAADLPASGSLGGLGTEAAEHDHSPDTRIKPADLQAHGVDGGSSPPPAVLDHAAAVDAAPAHDQPAVAAPVHEVAPSAAGPGAAAVSNSDHGIQTGPSAVEPHPAAGADSHANPVGQSIAHQFDLLIAAGNAAGQTEGLIAATPHHANVSDGGMIGGLDASGLDLGGAKHVTNNAPADVTLLGFGHDNPSTDGATAPGTQAHGGLPSLLSELASDSRTNELTVSPDPGTANEPGPLNPAGAAGGPSSPPSVNPDGHNGETNAPQDTKEQTNAPVDHNPVDHSAGGPSSPTPIIASGASFWTVAVDHLGGSGHASMPTYMAGNDMSLGSLAASHLDNLHNLATVLGVH
jgi:hypothetical protein